MLAATAYGLAAAIPASIGYNRIGAAFARLGQDMASFVEERALGLICAPGRGGARRRAAPPRRGAVMAMKPRKIGEGLYQPLAEINVTPLVDVMLVLLIIFMVTAPMLAAGIKVNLPNAQTAQPLEAKDPVVVVVARDGAVSVGKDFVSRERLVATVKGKLGQSSGVVQLRGDRDAAYGDVVSVMDDLAANGVTRIAIVSSGGRAAAAGRAGAEAMTDAALGGRELRAAGLRSAWLRPTVDRGGRRAARRRARDPAVSRSEAARARRRR